jgi:hypothetical protein
VIETVTLLGVAASADANAVMQAMQGVAGPKLFMAVHEDVALFAQATEKSRALLRRRDKAALVKALYAVQRRLEVACQTAAFLPADPAGPPCSAKALPGMLADAGPQVAASLAREGGRHQWEVTIRWPAEPVLARRRDEIAQAAAEAGGSKAGLARAVATALQAEQAFRSEALRQALASHVIALASPGRAASEIETTVTVLVPRHGETAIEAAFAALPAAATLDASADLKGPLPPFSFATCTIASADPDDLARAWAQLALPAQADAGDLNRRWRAAAFEVHPDRAQPAADGAPIEELGQSYRLLRDMLRGMGEGRHGLADLIRRGRQRLVTTPDAMGGLHASALEMS